MAEAGLPCRSGKDDHRSRAGDAHQEAGRATAVQWPSTRCGRIARTSFPRHWKRIQGRITLVDGRHDQYSIHFPEAINFA